MKLSNLVVGLIASLCAFALFAASATAGPSAGGGLVIADFNGDGDDDILFRNTTDGFVGFWYLNGVVISDGFGVPDPGLSFQIVGAGYFDDDAIADILWVESNGDMVIWFMGDKQITSAMAIGQPGGALLPAGIGDIDNNGNSDIIFQDATSVAVWLMDNGAFLSGASIGEISDAWVVTGMGDIDRDEKADILFRNTTDGFVGFWTLDGTLPAIITAGAGVPDPGADFEIRGFGDTNHDGSADVVWVDTSTANDNITTWQLDPTLAIGGFMPYGAPGAPLTLAAIADTDASGNSDFIFRDPTSVAEWLLKDDGGFMSGASVGTIANVWEVLPNVN